MYKQPVILFGIVFPLLGAGALIAACFVVHSKLSKNFAEKEAKYHVHDQNVKVAQRIETRLGKQLPHISRWTEELSEETAGSVSANLRLISEKLPPKEFQQTAFDRQTETGGFGAVSAQKASRVRIGFRGSFRTVQQAFLELETRMPRLQLEDLSVTPAAGTVPQLNFQATYTSWEQ